jgi:SAM-dependent methyltransferase
METPLIREEALPYCIGNGIDIGYGGCKIKKSAISLDLYMWIGGQWFGYDPLLEPDGDELNYGGDGRDLPFRDQVMDYVYSSHCLEDFENTREVLTEWVRVLKIGGYLLLYLPIQKVFVEFCESKGWGCGNASHKVDMSPEYLIDCVKDMSLEVVKIIPFHAIYSFFIVLRKL